MVIILLFFGSTIIPIIDAQSIKIREIFNLQNNNHERDINKFIFGYANKEGYANEMIFNHLVIQNFDSVEDMRRMAGPEGTYTDRRVLEALRVYKDLYDKGYFIEMYL